MNLIILTGAPASGKSSLAESLSKRLNIPWYSKDKYKIELFNKYGFVSHDEKKKLSIQGEKQLINRIYEAVNSNQNIIVDNNFKNFNAIKELLKETQKQCNIICIYLYADSRLLAERYNKRISDGKREVSLYSLNQYPVIEGVTQFHKPLDAEDVDNIQKAVTEEMYGDYCCRINTNELEIRAMEIELQIYEFIIRYIKES